MNLTKNCGRCWNCGWEAGDMTGNHCRWNLVMHVPGIGQCVHGRTNQPETPGRWPAIPTVRNNLPRDNHCLLINVFHWIELIVDWQIQLQSIDNTVM